MDAFAKYCEKFGSPKKAIENLPYQLTAECFRNPDFLEEDERLDALFAACVERGKAFTEHEFVDCLYRDGEGKYSFADISDVNYDAFIKRVSKVDIDY